MFGASKYTIEASIDGELIDTRLELPGSRKTKPVFDPIDRASIRPSLWKGIERPLASIFICVTLLLGGAGAGLETWWLQSGRYLVPEKRETSRLLQRVREIEVVRKQEQKRPAEAGPSVPVLSIADIEPAPEAVPPAAGDVIVDAGNGQVDSTSEIDAAATEPGPPVELPTVGEDQRTRIASAVADSFKVPVKRPVSPNHAERGRQAAFALLDGSFGMDAGEFENGSARLNTARRDGSFGVGRMAAGNDEPEVNLGAMAAAEADKNGETSGFGHSGAARAFLLAENDLPSGQDFGKIARNAGKLDTKIGEGKKETNYKDFVLVRRLRHKSGGDLDKQAVFEIIRGKRGALGRCYRRHAKDNPYSSGKIEVRIRIDMTGRIKAKVISNSVEDPQLAACVISKFQRWDLPAPSGKPVEVVVPLVFRSK